jgi:hypothetical protein
MENILHYNRISMSGFTLMVRLYYVGPTKIRSVKCYLINFHFL